MLKPAARRHESSALSALRRLEVLDTAPEAQFDALVKAASAICKVPISLISLVDADRQWFKANVGLPGADETPRDISFCGHAVLAEELFVVPNALADDRFADNPLVTGDPAIRFYAGAPIVLSSGEAIGTLCVIDRVPRELDDEQRKVLSCLAEAAARALEGRRALEESITIASELARNQAELARVNETLEDRVKERTASLAEAVERAEQASRAKSAFLSNMSHELRTPLNGVIGMAHLAMADCSDAGLQARLQDILNCGEHLLEIIGDVLDLSKIESGHMEIEEVDVDVASLLGSLAGQFGPIARKKGVTLAFETSPALRGLWRTDPTRLNQVIRNHLDNAIKFTSQGGVTIRTSLQSELADRAVVRFEITDTGIGVSEDQLLQIFKPFEQADSSTTRVYGGTGLGLAINKKLVAMLGGESGVTSAPGLGSTFWFTAALKPVRRRSGTAAGALAAGHGVKPTPLQGMNILLAEDNELNQALAAQILKRAGANVKTADNGQQALDALQTFRFDCVLMDVQMPVLDGLEATRRIRNDVALSGLPIIAFTANALPADRDNCMQAGMNDFVVKPVSPPALYEAISKWARTDSAARDRDALAER